MTDEAPHIWQNCDPAETTKAYASFCAYRDTPARTRSFQSVGEKYHGDKWSPSKLRQWQRLSVRFDWQKRCVAYDDYWAAQKHERLLDALDAMQDTHLEEARLMQKVGMESLNRTMADMDENPKKKLSPALALQLVQQGSSIERLTLGEPTEINANVRPTSWTEWLARQRSERGLPPKASPFSDPVATATNGNGNGNGNGTNGSK